MDMPRHICVRTSLFALADHLDIKSGMVIATESRYIIYLQALTQEIQ